VTSSNRGDDVYTVLYRYVALKVVQLLSSVGTNSIYTQFFYGENFPVQH